jgi:hypothetical protein
MSLFYHVSVNRSGRLFKIFDINYILSVKVDANTGRVSDANSPWWTFFVSGDE